ncbi:MAG: hypothetical protein Q9207_003182 [Kuettlingeria erythrocarpa]
MSEITRDGHAWRFRAGGNEKGTAIRSCVAGVDKQQLQAREPHHHANEVLQNRGRPRKDGTGPKTNTAGTEKQEDESEAVNGKPMYDMPKAEKELDVDDPDSFGGSYEFEDHPGERRRYRHIVEETHVVLLSSPSVDSRHRHGPGEMEERRSDTTDEGSSTPRQQFINASDAPEIALAN